MRALAFILVGLYGALALPATHGDNVLCTSDALFTSLSRDGRSFCSSVLEGRCHQEATPTQYATYDPTVISQHCKCVMTTDTCKESATPTGLSSHDGADVTSVTVTKDGSLVTVTVTHTQTSTTEGGGDSESGGQSTTRPITSSDPTFGTTATPDSTSSGSDDGAPGRASPPSSSSGSSRVGTGTSDATSSSQDPNIGDTTRDSSTATTTDPRSGSSPSSGVPEQTGSSSEPRQSSSSGSAQTDSLSSSTESGRWNASSTSLGLSSTGSPGTATSDSSSSGQSSGSNDGGPETTRSDDTPESSTTATLGSSNTTAPPLSSETGSTRSATSQADLTSGPGSSPSSSGASSPGSASLSVIIPTLLPNTTTAAANTSNTASSGITTTLPPTANTTSTATGPQQTLPAANFTQVTRTGAVAEETCYHLPQDPLHGRTRRAMLRNDELREHNYTIPFPYIESVDFDEDGVDPLFLTLRDAARGTHYIDVSSRSQLSIVDSLGNAMTLDGRGVHFSTNSCRYDVSMTIDGLYAQLATLSGQVCSKGRLLLLEQRMDNTAFRQAVNLRDQCGNPVDRAVRKYPLLKVGDSECSDVGVSDDDATKGRWLFECAFPGSESGAMRCQRAVATDIVKFLFVAPFGGSCPDLSTVITTLEATSQDFLTPASLRTELYDKGLNETQRGEADLAVMYYEQLWEILKQAFSKTRTKPPGVAGAIQQYVDTYSSFGSFENDLCRDLHAPDPPLNVSLRAGAAYLPVVAVLSAPPPRPPRALNLTIQDQAKVACCPRGSVSNYGQTTAGNNGSCTYPDSALIANSGCVCGRTAAGASVAFEYSECENFVARCATDADCATEGHPGFLCLTGSCCGGGVCIDPYECSRNGTGLLG
ncbi:nuclear condensin complex subunit Smc4 [Hirsutella rhossiliensis]|uniref:Nuclear condensin complex subunit Smc4 n=1 Tax=Hirsutella rhossiliensis TaxID=111463 RepID=A0A9P8MNM8_9HYPO|nr:nuclear condensin complex subunit Smc4 [Hirsutella rhossiliensis]KAH0958282.1 nuclear condensin complex subunit Smc4 [Hirsutella rhossiliensis]